MWIDYNQLNLELLILVIKKKFSVVKRKAKRFCSLTCHCFLQASDSRFKYHSGDSKSIKYG